MKNKKNAFQIIRRIYGHTLKTVPFSGTMGVLNYIVQGLFPATTSLVLSKLFDTAHSLTQGSDVFDEVMLYGGAFVLTYAMVYVFQFISSITINAGIYERCTSYYNMKISEKAASLPLIFFEDTELLNLQNRAKDCANREILSQIYMSSTVFITSLIGLVSTIAVLASYNIWLVPVSIISVIPYIITRLLRGKEFYLLKKAQSKKTRKLSYLWSLFHDKQSIKEMRIMGFGQYLSKLWIETRDEVNEELWKQNIKDGRSMLFCDMLKIIGYGLSVLLALYLVIKGYISIGVFGACISAFKAMQESTKSFLIDLGNLPEKIAIANDYFSFLDLPDEHNGTINSTGLNEGISLSNVSFAYPNSKGYALDKITFDIHKGEKIIVLGVNGSGKTTLAKIILGIYSPSYGEVRYDGILSSGIDKKSLYNYISIVPQDYISYKLTLRESIGISDTKNIQNDSLINETLLLSGLQSLMAEVGSLDNQLGGEYGGKELSGGQWQKIAIARALFKKAELVILDEPTSSLDPLVETEILQQFVKIAKDKTAVIISHRVGLCKLADRIIVMKNGKICEMGTHYELIKNNGEYKKLYNSQKQWYL